MIEEIPKTLIDQIREGQVVLFLGSGASIGAIHPKNMNPPDGKKLAEYLTDKFLDKDYIDRPLAQIAELAISEVGLLVVQEYIASIFKEFQPAPFHKIIPKLPWISIVTTNYDLIMERAYSEITDKIQNLVVFKKNGERIEDKIRSNDNLPYYKLHGCITDTNDKDVPLILTPDQYITHKKGRSRLFERVQSLAYDYPFLFIGHSLADPDIREILLNINELSDAKPRSYIVMKKMLAAEKRLWGTKKFTCIEGTFEDFITTVNSSISTNFRSLFKFLREDDHPIHKKFKVPKEIKPSESLINFLNRNVTYINKNYKTEEIDAQAFYKGYSTDFTPIIYNLDVKRSVEETILLEVFLTEDNETKRNSVEFNVIKGHAGSGKSVLLKRIAWDATIELEKLCLFVLPSSTIQYEPLYELYSLCKERIFLFIDPLVENKEIVEEIIYKGNKDNLPITIICAERNNEWNLQCEELEIYVDREYELTYLSETEIESLINLLKIHNSLGYLKEFSFEQQKEALSKKAGRQLLVALHEATLGKPFSDIILDEYNSITVPEAQSLYLTVCVLNRLGTYTRAGLISRVHNIPFNYFKQRLFSPLEFIVFTSKDDRINDYVYRARHPHIAEIVFERVLIDQQERYDEYVRIINVLDIDYNSDNEAFNKLLNAKHLLDQFKNKQMIHQLYAFAKERNQNNPSLLQQEAIFEMSSPGHNFDKATSLLQEAYKLAPHNNTIAHSLSELAFNKSIKATSNIEQKKLRQEAKKIATDLIKKGTVTSHPYHTILKVSLNELDEYISTGDLPTIERKMKEIEKIFANAVQNFPDDSFLFDAESDYLKMINKQPKAIESLEKAFKNNKRSPYIALRLAKMYNANKLTDLAINVLRDCLDANPLEKNVNYQLAYLLQKNNPDNKAEIKHYLRRSFTDGDDNYTAQFWFARFLYLEGEIKESMNYFDKLSDVKINPKTKRIPRGTVKEKGKHKYYSGVIEHLDTSYAFITRDGLQDKIFTHASLTDRQDWDSLKHEQRVIFKLSFNYRGPIAVDLKKE